MIRIGKALYHTMIRNGNGPVSPFISSLNDILCLGNTVHITHFRMTVQFHPLTGGGIHSCIGEIRNLLNTGNGSDSQFMIELIHHADTLYF